MDKVEQYKDRFSTRTDDQLKDIIAGRFEEYEVDAIKAAVALLKERQPNTGLNLEDIPKAKTKQLKEIIKNPEKWGERAVEVAKKEYIRRKHIPVDTNPSNTESGKAISYFLMILAVLGGIVVLYFMFLIFWILYSI